MADFSAHVANIIARIGQPVTITPFGLPPRVVNAVFSTQSADAFGMIGGFRPTLRITGNSEVVSGDVVLVGDRKFSIKDIDDDPDTGERLLRLESA